MCRIEDRIVENFATEVNRQRRCLKQVFMKIRKIFFVVLLLLTINIGFSAMAMKNPFMAFSGKPYGQYHYALRDMERARYKEKSLECLKTTMQQMQAVPDTYHDKQWELEAEFLSLKYRHKILFTLKDDDYEEGLKKMLVECRSCHNKIFELRVTRQLFDYYVDKNLIYDIAIYARALEKFFPVVTLKEFPDIIDFKMKLGSVYLSYRNFSRAEMYFRQVIASPMELPIQQIYVHARNNLGLIARTFHHDLNASDRWFLSIDSFYKKYHITYLADEWKAVMTGNLGTNQMLRLHYPQAIKMISKALEAKIAMRDYNYSFVMAYELVDCYCAIHDYDHARQNLEIAKTCFANLDKSVESSGPLKSYHNYYLALSRYYTGVGDVQKAYVWLDSAETDRDNYLMQYNMNPFYIVEKIESGRELNVIESQAQNYKVNFFSASAILVLISVLFFLCIVLLGKKRSAYKKLVERNRLLANQILETDAGAGGGDGTVQGQADDIPSNEKLIERIKQHLVSSQCYLNPELTINIVAREIGVNRSYLSSAINSEGSNFNSLINQFRVSYAIRLLSSGTEKSMEQVALSSGFNCRKSMYNAFRSITGVMPSNFRK